MRNLIEIKFKNKLQIRNNMNSLTASITESYDSNTITSTTDIENIDRAFIDTMQEESIIRMTDSDNSYGIQLFCYDNCNRLDSERVKQCRGIVFNGDTLIMKAFPYTEEIRKTDLETFESQVNLQYCKFYNSYEGMILRMFFFEDKWFISTHRKLDAFRSKWSSKVSFGEMFIQCLQRELENNDDFANSVRDTPEDLGILERFKLTLDKTKQYMFLLLTNEETRIVCLNDPNGSGMFHVGTFDSTTGESVETDIHVRKPIPLENTFSSLTEVYERAQTTDYTMYQGIIMFAPNNKQYKVLNSEYEYYFSVRGNEPSIKFRYLQVRNNIEYCKTLRQMYTNMVSSFDSYENYINVIAKEIYTSYVERFIKKNFITVPQEEYVIVKACHKWHQEDRKRNIVNLNRVFSELSNSHPSFINRLIRKRIHKERKCLLQED
jgi:hypothetical protein